MSRPGRGCPITYRYAPAAFARLPEIEVDTLWVAGGLYGNPFALQALLERYNAERGSKALVFNGDFHWFDLEDFKEIDDRVCRFTALRGNVETELAAPAEDAGCGCGYPEWVDEGTVERSNRIIERLRAAAEGFPEALERLRALPMHLVAAVGGERVAVVHGDAESLAGWGFSQEALATPAGRGAALAAFSSAKVRIFASSHSCLPVLQEFDRGRAIANNGSAGMPNFHGTTYGLATRISVAPSPNALYSTRAGGLFVEAIPLQYDSRAWQARFLAQWPEGSAAFRSYHGRIVNGPAYRIEQALRSAPALAA